MSARVVTVVGWDGAAFESSGKHECLEHETFETRAEFFNRTVEEEVVGVMMTLGPRAVLLSIDATVRMVMECVSNASVCAHAGSTEPRETVFVHPNGVEHALCCADCARHVP